MGKKNLKSQLLYAINSCFKGNEKINGGYGASKNSDKASKQKNAKIYSYSTRASRIEAACQFSAFLKEHYDVKNASELKAEMVESFLLSKSASCTTETLDCYRSNLSALGDNINRTFSTANVNLRVDRIVGTNANQESRCKPMEADHITALKNSYKPGSTGFKAVTLAEAAGLRASEIVKLRSQDIQIKGNSATVAIYKSKGGKNRLIEIKDASSVSALQALKESVPEGERIVNAKTGSIQKSINRHMNQIEGSNGSSLKSEYSHSGFHAIRKNWAQREYDRSRNEGLTRQEALDYVSNQLGHGNDRDLATLQRYISNIW